MSKSTSQEIITFYDRAAPHTKGTSIDCGSRAKPPLLDLEQQAPIKEAWLNRTETVYSSIGLAACWRPAENRGIY